jgi:glycosyltransferase involved in cell wall biosynthesis/peptidoglycan/xylan/chitin deacetylase (PgdA/CDA1 family)
MKVTVVVPTFNRRASLERCLSSLAVQNFPATEYEIVVVADGCTDDTEEFLRSFRPPCAFRWFAQSNQGAPVAQNFGIEKALGKIVLFLDDDCICDPEVIATHCEIHDSYARVVAIGAILLHPDSTPGALRYLVQKLEQREFARLSSEGAKMSDMMLCANSSVDRDAALACLFDGSYKRMHDVEAGIRLWEMGFRPQFAVKALVYEHYTKPARAMLRDSYFQGKYEVILTRRHPGFKPFTGIVNMNEGNPFKRASRKALSLHPQSSEFVLRSIGSILEAFEGLSVFSRLAARILGARAGIAHLKGAIEEAGSWKALEEEFAKRTPVVLYHNVGSPKPGEFPGLTTPLPEFKAQLSFLAKMGYEGIRPSQWLQWRNEGGMLPKRPIMIVFDDAYADACHNAFPVLEKYGFGAACMVVTQFVGSTNRWDEDAGQPSFQLMSECEILEWSRRGIEFGGHTASHPELPFLSQKQMEQEIARCKHDLTALLGRVPASFAYPFSSVNPEVEAVAREHFSLAFTAWQGTLHLGTNLHLAPRILLLPGESRFGMWCRLRIGRNLFEVCRGRWRRLTKRIRGGETPRSTALN